MLLRDKAAEAESEDAFVSDVQARAEDLFPSEEDLRAMFAEVKEEQKDAVVRAQTLDEFKTGIQDVFSVTEEQSEAVGELIEAHASVMGETADEHLQRVMQPESEFGEEPISVLFQKPLTAGKNEQRLEIQRLAQEKWGESEGMEYAQEAFRFMKDVEDHRNEWAISPNDKMIFSLDWDTNCPAAESGTSCVGCYAIVNRVQAEIMAEKKGISLEEAMGNVKAKQMVDHLAYEDGNRITDMPQALIDWQNANGGMRVHSFSDFKPENLPRYEGALADAAEVGLNLKIITKTKGIVDNFGDRPGVTINISTDFQHSEWFKRVQTEYDALGATADLKELLSPAPAIEQAWEWRAGRENIKVRYTARKSTGCL